MHTVTLSIYDGVSYFSRDSYDDAQDRLYTVLNNRYDTCEIGNVSFDVHYTKVGPQTVYHRYVERADILDHNSKKIGFYKLEKDVK